MRALVRTTLPLALAVAAACSRGPSRTISAAEVRAPGVAKLPAGPDDPAWRTAPIHPARLLPQDVVEPRLLEPSTAVVEVQALTDGERIAFRLAWAAPAPSDRSLPAVFPDACAVQVPASTVPDVPNPMMGEAGRKVAITYWRASWQATVDGRPETLAALYPNAKVDHYPFESASLAPGSPEQVAMARRYAPAGALENAMAGPRDRPVEDLEAEGAGTIRPAPAISTGAGKRTPEGWAVVLVRPLPPGVKPGSRTQVAFAVWQGARREAGPRKMRTGWVPLAVEVRP